MRFHAPAAMAALTVCGAAGCQQGQASRTTHATVRDSAGIEIVEHPAGFEESLPRWSVTELASELGSGEGPGHELTQVRGATRLPDGRIVVADGGSSELRFFDSTGKHLASSGRKGDGPGEFQGIGTVQRIGADTLGVLDVQLNRYSLLTNSGTFVRSVSVRRRSEQGYLGVSGPLSDGRLFGTLHPMMEMPKETSGPVRRDPFAVGIIGADGTGFDTLIVVPGYESFPAIGREGGHEFPTWHSLNFGRTSVLVTDGALIYIGTNEPAGIGVYQPDGRLIRLVRSLTPPDPVTEAHRQQRRNETLAGFERSRVSEAIKAEWKKNIEDARYAEVFPDYERLLIGTDGTLWQERPRRTADEGRRYVVYDASGTAIATVTCPERFRPYEVGPDEIIGMWRDADEVHHVRVYRLPRRAPRVTGRSG